MQTKTGHVPAHLVSEEVSEWLRLRAVPAMEKAARENFVPGKHEWFDERCYQRLRKAMKWPANKTLYLVSADMDTRHACTDMWEVRRRRAAAEKPGRQRDRRDLERGTVGWIDISRDQYIPSAPKVPDTIQQPIETFYSTVKHYVKQEYEKTPEQGWRPMVQAVDFVYDSRAHADSFAARWDHANTAIQVFAGTEDEEVQVGKRTVKCTHGGWVPKLVRA